MGWAYNSSTVKEAQMFLKQSQTFLRSSAQILNCSVLILFACAIESVLPAKDSKQIRFKQIYEEQWRMAVHEASHLVVALEVKSARVPLQSILGDSAGRTDFKFVSSSQNFSLEAEAAIQVAGSVGESVLLGEQPTKIRRPDTDIRSLQKWFFSKPGENGDFISLLESGRSLARSILTNNRKALLSIAETLLLEKKISAERARKIMSASKLQTLAQACSAKR